MNNTLKKSQSQSMDQIDNFITIQKIGKNQKVNNVRFTILDDLEELNQNINGNYHQEQPIQESNYPKEQIIDNIVTVRNNFERQKNLKPSHRISNQDDKGKTLNNKQIQNQQYHKNQKLSFKRPRIHIVQKIIDLTKEPDPKYLKEIETNMVLGKNYLEEQKQNKQYNLFSKAIQSQRIKGKRFIQNKK